MQQLLKTTVVRVALALLGVVLGAVGFLPLFGGPSYEFALAVGVFVPSLAAATAAWDVAGHVHSNRNRAARPLDLLGRHSLAALGLVLATCLIAVLHGARAGFCRPERGFINLALGPLSGVFVGAAWGVGAGLVAAWLRRRGSRASARRWAIALALAGPLLGIGISVLRFATSPMVFAMDPFFGFFAGPIYDTVFDPTEQLLTYRAGTLFSLVAIAAGLTHVAIDADGRLWLRRDAPVWVRWVLGIGMAGCFGLYLAGTRLGHFSTAASIERELGRELSYGRCDLVYSRNMSRRTAALTARECDAHLRQLEAFFEVRALGRVKVYLFVSTAEKGRLMGAARTYIAKPWRREIYIQQAPFPHPVLGHELAHVVAASFGSGPFRVAGPLRGLLPDPGRIEGVAVAASPSEDADVGLDQWARAMQKLGILPPLSRVFKLSFLGENSTKAYTVAGAFMAWLHRAYGAAAVRGWYAGTPLTELTGKDLDALEKEWHRVLAREPLSERTLRIAEARFDRPAIFGRRCPHEVDELAQEGYLQLSGDDPEGARQSFEQALQLDPEQTSVRLGLAQCELAEGRAKRAEALYRAVAEDRMVSRLHRIQALEAIADQALASGQDVGARAGYRELLDLIVDEDHARAIEVKLAALDFEPLARRAVVLLLIGKGGRPGSWDLAAPLLGRWRERFSPVDRSGLADYLIGRGLLSRQEFGEAERYLSAATAHGNLALPRIQQEAWRSLIVARCALGDVPGVERAYAALALDTSLPAVRHQGVRRLVERCGVDLLGAKRDD